MNLANPLAGRSGMNRGQGAGVAGVEKLQEIERLAGPDFAQQNPVWPVPQGCFRRGRGWEQEAGTPFCARRASKRTRLD